MSWFIAMVCILPLLAVGSPVRLLGVHIPWGQKGRTWAALFGASVAAWIVSGEYLSLWFAAIDAAAAWLILRQPLGEMQRAVGTLFIAMCGVDFGFTIACWMQPGPHDFWGYFSFNQLVGWVQWACLASWGAGDAMVSYFTRAYRSRSAALSGRDGA